MSYVAEQATAKAKYGVSHLQRQSASSPVEMTRILPSKKERFVVRSSDDCRGREDGDFAWPRQQRFCRDRVGSDFAEVDNDDLLRLEKDSGGRDEGEE